MPTSRKNQPPQPQGRPRLTMPHTEAAERLQKRIALGEEMKSRQISTETEMKSAREEYYSWSDYNYELLAKMFDNPSVANEYRGIAIGGLLNRDPLRERVAELGQNFDYKLNRLRSISSRLELYEAPLGVTPTTPSDAQEQSVARRDVFIVHGHNEAAKQTVARYLEQLDCNPIILHEQLNKSQATIEKFEANAARAAFAVVILSPDDIGGPQGTPYEQLRPRARQNVVAELFYFFGKIGRDHVCALMVGEIEEPSDIAGVMYEPMDTGGGWKQRLAQELNAAGMDIDFNKVFKAR